MTFMTFGCRHANLTFPQKRGGITTQVCLGCGSEFEYDWQQMKRMRIHTSAQSEERESSSKASFASQFARLFGRRVRAHS